MTNEHTGAVFLRSTMPLGAEFDGEADVSTGGRARGCYGVRSLRICMDGKATGNGLASFVPRRILRRKQALRGGDTSRPNGVALWLGRGATGTDELCF